MTYNRTSYAVWEITLKCNLACSHCGSRAGRARTQELSTEEALDLVKQMAEVGIKEVTLIGGEAFLRPDWLQIATAITQAGMLCTMTTGGYGISLDTACRMKEAGIRTVSISVDGLEATHDRLRGKKGSWQYAFKTMSHLGEVGIPFGCNTQINRLSAPEFPCIYEHIRDAGAKAWQIQLTVPMGNAADNADILLQPYELLDIYPMLARVARHANREGVKIQPGNNIGYYGPYERLLRGGGDEWTFWQGCAAGLSTLGIEADGAIKGCPSLPTTAYTGAIFGRDRSEISSNTQTNSASISKLVRHREQTICGDSAKVVNLLSYAVGVAPGLLMFSLTAEGIILIAIIALSSRLNGGFGSEFIQMFLPKDFPLTTVNLLLLRNR